MLSWDSLSARLARTLMTAPAHPGTPPTLLHQFNCVSCVRLLE